MAKFQSIVLIAVLLISTVTFAQSTNLYNKKYSTQKVKNFPYTGPTEKRYGMGKVKYNLYKGSGSKTDKANYQLQTTEELLLDVYAPITNASLGKRAVVIIIPSGGRSGCLADCSTRVEKGPQASHGQARYIAKDSQLYKRLTGVTNAAKNLAKSGVVALALNTRYTYHNEIWDRNIGSNGRFKYNNSNRWKDGANGKTGSNLFAEGAAPLEPLVVDIKRAIRWITKNQSTYNIDPDSIFIQGSSGGGKMVGLANITGATHVIADDPSHWDAGNAEYNFETTHNHRSTPQKPLRGALMINGDLQGIVHNKLIKQNAGAFMFWHGTKDRSIKHGVAESIEERCDIVGCKAEFYSMPNGQHGGGKPDSASGMKYMSALTNQTLGLNGHFYEFIVRHMNNNGTANLPRLSIDPSASNVKFNENTGTARIKINLSKPATQQVKFVAASDQTREVIDKGLTTGKFSDVINYVANDALSPTSPITGTVSYFHSTAVAYEFANNVSGGDKKNINSTTGKFTSGKGKGNYAVISSDPSAQATQYYHHDFKTERKVITINPPDTSAFFDVTIYNDNRREQNECFKVRLLNASGATIANGLEVITIDDKSDNPSASSSSKVCGNPGTPPTTDNATISLTSTHDVDEPAGEAGTPAVRNIPVVVDGTLPAGGVTVNYRTVVTSPLEAEFPADFGYADSSIDILPGQPVAIPIRIKADDYDASSPEGDERFKLQLTGISGSNLNNVALGNKVSVITIRDNTDNGSIDDKPEIVFNPASGELSGPVTVTITDNEGIVGGVSFRGADTSPATFNTPSCVNETFNGSNPTKIVCIVTVTSDGSFVASATDTASQSRNKVGGAYTISTTTPDNKPNIIFSPANGEISGSVTVTITDNEGIVGGVSFRGAATNPATFNTPSCVNETFNGSNPTKIVCTVTLTSDGSLVATATDTANQTRNKAGGAYTITQGNTPSVITFNPESRPFTSPFTLTISVKDVDGIKSIRLNPNTPNIADTASIRCSVINPNEQRCTVWVRSAGRVTVRVEDNSGDVIYRGRNYLVANNITPIISNILLADNR